VHVMELERGLVNSLPHVLQPTIHYLQGVLERVKEHTDWQHDPVLANVINRTYSAAQQQVCTGGEQACKYTHSATWRFLLVCWRAQTVKEFRFLYPADSPQLPPPPPLPIVATTATTAMAMATEAAAASTTTTPLSPTQPPPKRRRTTPEATARLEEIKSICTHNSIIMVTLVSGACIPIDEYRQTPSNLARLQAFYNSTRATEHMRRLYCSAIANQSQ